MNRKTVARQDYYRISIRHQHWRFPGPREKFARSIFVSDSFLSPFFFLLTCSYPTSQLIDIITRCHSRYVVSISNHTGGPMEKFNWGPRNSQFNSSQPANARRAGKNYLPRMHSQKVEAIHIGCAAKITRGKNLSIKPIATCKDQSLVTLHNRSPLLFPAMTFNRLSEDLRFRVKQYHWILRKRNEPFTIDSAKCKVSRITSFR